MKRTWLIIVIGLFNVLAGSAWASTPSGFSTTTLTLTAQITVACQEVQHVAFPDPLVIDTRSASDQTIAATSDEMVACTNGTVFTVKVTSGNGTAVEQTCTSSGISDMALKSAGSPADKIAYTLICAGDTDGLGHFTGAGFNTPRSIGMSIRILASNAQNAVVHADYSDSVMISISY